MVMLAHTIDSIWQALEAVKDPEIPVVSVVDMGIVRDIALEGTRVVVTITPTFSGCPALVAMQEDIVARLKDVGIEQVEVKVTLSPPWTTEWIKEEARASLKSFGLAPPPRHDGDFIITLLDAVECPYCESTNTSLRNSFGPTLCRAIFYCNNCNQPFEQFKPL
jgi:ring-1,2-phenylacetyl-CoA epoxidase subunit PaaD